jgi:ribonuclease HI
MWWYRQKYRDGNRHFWIKVNTDGAVDFVNGRAGAGMIVRDDQGQFIRAKCKQYANIQDPFVIELLACWEAIEWAHQAGMQKVCVETDCQTVVSAWQEEKEQRSAVFQIVQEMKQLCSVFQGLKFIFVRREANRAANGCARHALSSSITELCFDVSPGFLSEVVQAELVSSIQ